jgi:hypothetical protein
MLPTQSYTILKEVPQMADKKTPTNNDPGRKKVSETLLVLLRAVG